MQVKDLSIKEIIKIGITFLFFLACASIGLSLPILVIHFLK